MDANLEQVIAVAQLTTEILGQAQSAMGLYLTVISGYLLVAYFLGSELTRLQTVIITVLFVFFGTANTFAIVSYFESAAYFGHTYGAGRAPLWAGPGIAVTFGGGILAALKFMWDVRQPKGE